MQALFWKLKRQLDGMSFMLLWKRDLRSCKGPLHKYWSSLGGKILQFLRNSLIVRECSKTQSKFLCLMTSVGDLLKLWI